MTRFAFALTGALLLTGGVLGAAAPAQADEPVVQAYRAPPEIRTRTVYRPRTIVRRVVVERPVYRTRRIVREVVVERPVYLRPRPIYREVFDDGFDGPPPFYGPPPFRPRPVFAYGPGFGPGPYPPFRPRPYGWGYGPGPFF
ncbi:hypothetical protein [Methylobacterium sp. WL9]|uniref:hypothetical protein n=1 Tax=Methylobacterium sp. WL9 TaxID=2603898 RepID=UPI00164F3C17|nr:hypothetical protein [Methylobacterium sp. WL9]